MAFIEASLEELPVRADLGPSCLATKISAPGPSLLGGSATGRERLNPLFQGIQLCLVLGLATLLSECFLQYKKISILLDLLQKVLEVFDYLPLEA